MLTLSRPAARHQGGAYRLGCVNRRRFVRDDGAIDTDFTRQRAPDRYEEKKAAGGILNPESIAENYWMLHNQPRDAWTHELDLRPWSETW